MPKPDGSIAELSVIRPLWWLQGTGAAVGGSIDIGLHEIGLSGEATVLAIRPCDVDSRETRPGMSIVTGTIRHRNATVWDLTFDDRTEEALGVTANHPLYSETRHAWISAGDLQLDEVVRTLNGHSTLTARTQHPTRETVFNLEVHRSHAYHVSGLGVLAHNSSILDCTKTNIHRGGSDFKPKYDMGEVKMKDGLVQPTRGVSLELDIADARKHGTPHRLVSIPNELEIVQQGKRLGHHEIRPKVAMTKERFEELLGQIVTEPIP